MYAQAAVSVAKQPSARMRSSHFATADEQVLEALKKYQPASAIPSDTGNAIQVIGIAVMSVFALNPLRLANHANPKTGDRACVG